MSLNSTPASDRIHIAFFGKRNAGKSSVVNAVTGQSLSIVSEVKGTTTDPVYKAMELLPLGPVMMIDTPGLDDEGDLGKLRVQKGYQVLNKTDLAVLVVDATLGMTAEDFGMIRRFRQKNIPFLVVYNKIDLVNQQAASSEWATAFEQAAFERAAPGARGLSAAEFPSENILRVSSVTGENIQELKERIAKLVPAGLSQYPIVSDLLSPGDFVVLVVPIDSAAPKGRLILPQQQTIRDVLEAGAAAIVVKETELTEVLKTLGKKPRIVITDSQVFARVSSETPEDIPLTSFSILFARHKGNLGLAIRGASALERLQDGDTVLIAEGCTHHRQCDDIGTQKLPRWIRQYTGKNLEFRFSSGTEFPEDLNGLNLVVHCGGCMLNEREVKYRLQCAEDQEIPVTNYGVLIAYMQGILDRCVSPILKL
jgi:[FeFe] hydrogenase H-cluster maturation GTPase HydF